MVTVKSGNRNSIVFPENLLHKLDIEDGEKVDIKVKRGVIVIIKDSEDFFALEGALKDTDIESNLKEINKSWKKWKPPKSL
jgi:antitoxin component of MazEF toxin-antitoxin module